MKQYRITKVVSRDFITDFIAGFQNLIGSNLTGYEKMMEKGMDQIENEIKEKRINLKWFRYEMTQLTNGAVAITLYGEVR